MVCLRLFRVEFCLIVFLGYVILGFIFVLVSFGLVIIFLLMIWLLWVIICLWGISIFLISVKSEEFRFLSWMDFVCSSGI